ncbi:MULTISPECIES: flavin reductase family protein [Pigmentiphaga]|uniref:Flavin reductase (DIM6/NTAB) family NADH-FMN oxidoreductase RutF n=1 Tax=Pigmentiphaga kullae TaxID=151784 RepID=A0A4Q7NJC5_9BURK|nr:MULTISPECIES: flavin reductase family protein [Pigmentiphaga]RZS85164.1 flavin reductase (DIM6/NTAB) family NADH-FMN oxidoreductase RutF [Pigmentiphaga kullae]
MTTKIRYLPDQTDPARLYKLVAGLVVPRPIALVSTVDRDGRANLAPFSWFNAVSTDPPYLCISIGRHAGDRPKDTLNNILATGEFVVNLVGEAIAPQQDACAQAHPSGVDEFQASGLTPAPASLVRPPCVAESKAWFECTLTQALPLPRGSYTLVLGEVVAIHVDSDVVGAQGRIDMAALRGVGRLAGRDYCRLGDAFSLEHDSFNRFGQRP